MVALLNLSSWCLVMVEWLFLAVPWGCLRFVIVVFPDHTHLLFFHKAWNLDQFLICKEFAYIWSWCSNVNRSVNALCHVAWDQKVA